MKEYKIALGDRVKDSITGFEGIAICRSSWMHGCERITVQPQTLDKEGKPKAQDTFDEAQLVILKAGAVASKAGNDAGPRPDIPRGR